MKKPNVTNRALKHMNEEHVYINTVPFYPKLPSYQNANNGFSFRGGKTP